MIWVFSLSCFIVWFSFFKECPHPDDKQRSELSRRLGLETKQVKFWFQNRRTQMKVNNHDSCAFAYPDDLCLFVKICGN